jgi:Ca-activated chloride channel homolog
MFNPYNYRNSTVGGAPYMETLRSRDAERANHGELDALPLFMPLKSTMFSGSVTGPVARLQVRHMFGQPPDLDSPVLEAAYRFPLPGDAAVIGVVASFGETKIEARLDDRERAEAEYDEARATGRQAALLARESPDVFTLHVSGIESGQDIEIVTSFVQTLNARQGGFTLRLPLTVTPRFTSFEGAGGRYEHGQPLALAYDPGHRVRLDLDFHGAGTVTSKTHDLTIVQDGVHTKVRFSDDDLIPDRDLVVNLSFQGEGTDPSLRLFRYQDEKNSHEYFLTLVQPPDDTSHRQASKPRELILLVDRSGSMYGAKWEAADWAVSRFLSGLEPDDYFSIGLFHDETRWFSRVSVPSTKENVRSAREFVTSHNDSGGTYLERALDEAISCGRASGDFSRHILIVTDAQITNATTNLELARAESRHPARRRISMLCIDAAPNSWLVHEIVSNGGGHASFLTSDPDEGDITSALDDIMRIWGRPVESGLSLTINRSEIWTMGRPVQDFSTGSGQFGTIEIGDVPAGMPIWVVARASSSSEPVRANVSSDRGTITSMRAEVIDTDDSLKLLFGARRLAVLEYQLESTRHHYGRLQMDEASSGSTREQLVAESLNYGLICSETAFVATREEAGKLVQRGAIVPNAMAHGWASDFMISHGALADAGPPAMQSTVLESRLDQYPLASASFSYRTDDAHETAPPQSGGILTLFDGTPDAFDAETVLANLERFGHSGLLTGLLVTLSEEPDDIDGELHLFIGNEEDPRVRLKLDDVLMLGGRRPLNIRIRSRDSLRLVLKAERAGKTMPPMIVELEWK